jgi:hypothetical protein
VLHLVDAPEEVRRESADALRNVDFERLIHVWMILTGKAKTD